MIDAIILCGGQGTRVKHLFPDLPKVLYLIKKRPFLDFVIAGLYLAGYRRFILATGYLNEKIEDYAQKSSFKDFIVISHEDKPLGTGGAIKNAEQHIESDDFFVLNGDSLVDVDMNKMLDFHLDHGDLATIGIARSDRTDAGNININENGMVTSFNEKKKKGEYINAGIYLFNKDIFDLSFDTPYSLEVDILPILVKFGTLYSFLMEDKVIDIGTEERYVNLSG